MKIIITVNTYYPLKDGVQAVTKYLAEGLINLGHEVILLTPMEKGCPNEEIYNGVKIIRVNIHTVHAMYVGDKVEYRDLVVQLTKDADAMINVCTQTAMTDLLYPILSQIKCRKILYMHGMTSFKWNKEDLESINRITHKVWNNIRWSILYERSGKYYRLYNHITQLHRFDSAFSYFKYKYGITCDIIENAADPEFFNHNYEKKLSVPDSYAIYVANYIERKNQGFILESFYKSRLSKGFGLILIGSEETPYFQTLVLMKEKLEKQYGPKNVKLLYRIERKNISEYVKRASIYLMGSRWEAFPISIIEAMAAGIPFISTDVGCVRFLPGGVVVKTSDEMSYWLELMASNEEVRQNLGKTGALYANKNLTIESKVKQLEKLLRN